MYVGFDAQLHAPADLTRHLLAGGWVRSLSRSTSCEQEISVIARNRSSISRSWNPRPTHIVSVEKTELLNKGHLIRTVHNWPLHQLPVQNNF